MIKNYLYILFFSVFFESVSQQTIQGNYYELEDLNVTSNRYRFNPDGTFLHQKLADISITHIGKGHYSIKNDSLILNYDLTELNQNSYYKSKTYFNNRDSITVKIQVFDNNRNGLANLYLYSYPEVKSVKTDKNGVATFSFSKKAYKNKKEIVIEGEFLDKLKFNISLDRNYEIDAFMAKSKNAGFYHPKAIKNQVDKFKIINLSKNVIKLKNSKKTITLKK